LLIREIIKLSTVFVTGSGNEAGSPNGYPALFGDPDNRNYIPELIVIGSVTGWGFLGGHADALWVTCYAPGFFLRLATSGLTDSRDPGYQSTLAGTLYASATVAGLAAYFRGLDDTLTTAAMVKERIVRLAYRWQPTLAYPNEDYPDNVVWNGQKWG
jgi:subtilisin family serine protease